MVLCWETLAQFLYGEVLERREEKRSHTCSSMGGFINATGLCGLVSHQSAVKTVKLHLMRHRPPGPHICKFNTGTFYTSTTSAPQPGTIRSILTAIQTARPPPSEMLIQIDIYSISTFLWHALTETKAAKVSVARC